MAHRKARCTWLGALATTGAALLPLTMTPAIVHGDDTLPFVVMGGTGMPVPDDDWVATVQSLFFPSEALFDGQPAFPDAVPDALYTPQEFYPLNFGDLTLNDSVSQGLSNLIDELQPYLDAGTPVGVFGYSQSAIIASLAMDQLTAQGVPSSDVNFVLIGDLMNPNGGLFERFAGLELPSLGIDFSGATPSDDFATTIYTMEYDTWADFPRYPLNLLSVLNAYMSETHFDYDTLTPEQIAQAIPLDTTGGLTDYYIIPVDDLPLLDPLREVPIIGNPLADLLQPNLTALVNLGYGDPEFGWSTAPANEATEFGLLPSLADFEKLPGLLIAGTQTGIEDFIGDFTGTGPNPVSWSLDSLLDGLTDTSSLTSGTVFDPDEILSALTTLLNDPAALTAFSGDIADALSDIGSTLSATYDATEDILQAALISVPEYNLSLIMDNLDNPIEALGLSIGADLAIYPLLGGFAQTVFDNAAESILATLTDLVPSL